MLCSSKRISSNCVPGSCSSSPLGSGFPRCLTAGLNLVLSPTAEEGLFFCSGANRYSSLLFAVALVRGMGFSCRVGVSAGRVWLAVGSASVPAWVRSCPGFWLGV